MSDLKNYIKKSAYAAVKEFSKHNPDTSPAFLQGLFDQLINNAVEFDTEETVCRGVYLLFCKNINRAIKDHNAEVNMIQSVCDESDNNEYNEKEDSDDEDNEEDLKDNKRHYRVEICTGDMERELVMDVELDDDKTVIPDYSNKIH
jgi:hypothetical protein